MLFRPPCYNRITDTVCMVGAQNLTFHLSSLVAILMISPLRKISDLNNPLEDFFSLTWNQTPARIFLYSMLLLQVCLIHSALGSPLEECVNMLVYCYFIHFLLLWFQITMSLRILRVQRKSCLWALRLGIVAPIFSFKSGTACLSWPSILLLHGGTRPSKR